MSSSFKSELLKEVSKQDDPVIRTDSIALKFQTQKEIVVKTLLELKSEGHIFFLVKPGGDLYLTHIDGEEIEWSLEEEDLKQGLFDMEGNLHIEPNEFFDYISQLPESNKEQNKILFEELSHLEDEEYQRKVIEIATMNIKLIRKVVFAVLQTEPLYDEELRYFYKMMITQFCRAVEKFDYTTDYTFGTYSAWWIFQASSRARSKIIQKRLDDEWGFTVGLQLIDEKARDLKISLDRYPSYDEIYKELEPVVKEKVNKSLEKKELMEEKHFHNIGLNKLFTEIVRSEIIIEPSYDDRLRLNSAIEYLEAREADIINKRFGLHDEKFEYGLTLDEIGLDYKLTRERIRQIINDAIEKIRYYFKDEDLENDKLPFVFFPNNVKKFLKINKIEYFSDLSTMTIEDFRQMENSSKKVVDALIRTLESLGIKLEATKEGEIKFNELSVRAQNALKKQNLIFEDALIHLSEQDLNFIPNIGEKTIKELIAYQKRLKGNNKKEFSPEKVILFPCANPVSQRNFSKTMDKQNSIESIKSYLLVNQYNDLKNIGDEFFFWGTKSGEKKWSEIPHKSLALFFANKFAFSYGFVEYKLINQPLSDYFWGRNEESDSSYKYMFACSEVKETSIPQHIVNETLGYKENFVVQGFMVLNIKQSLDLLNLVNKYKFD